MFVEPHGITVLHWWNEVGHLLKLIREKQIRLFVEIGILHGGLSRIIMDQCVDDPGFRYIGIELAEQYVEWKCLEFAANLLNAEVRMTDAHSPECVAMVAQEIQKTQGPAFVYCDGGDKAKESRLYWPVLRSGDVLGLHDFGNADEPGIEVSPKDIEHLTGARTHGAETRILTVVKP